MQSANLTEAAKRRLIFAIAALVSSGAVFASCQSSSSGAKSSKITCKTADDCPYSQICEQSVCMEADYPCGGCPAGKKCNLDGKKCVTAGCVKSADCERPGLCNASVGLCYGEPDKPENCVSPCIGGQVCLNGACAMPPCRFMDDCLPSETCEFPSGKNLGECKTIACKSDADCRKGYYCDAASAACLAPCKIDDDCGKGKQCKNNRCGLLPPECDDDYDCANRKICDEFKQCSWGEACAFDADCGEGRVCEGELSRCAPSGCQQDYDCDRGICDYATHQCVNKIPTGGGCADDSQCLTGVICIESVCQKLCDPLKLGADCQAGYGCNVITAGALVGQGKGVCKPYKQGFPAGVICAKNSECEVHLLCVDGICSAVCDASAGETSVNCRQNQLCRLDYTLNVGLCAVKPCDDAANPCLNGKVCNNGKCVECYNNSHCPERYMCEGATHKCVEDCSIRGCESGWCNINSGRCEMFCTPNCQAGQECINGTCVSIPCVPACEYGFRCIRGECRPIACINPSEGCGPLAKEDGAVCCAGLTCCEVYPGSGGKCCSKCKVDGSCE